MKIVILNTSERTGGAAVAAKRLMNALNESGHHAKMLVRDKQTNDENVHSINTSSFKRRINILRFAWERFVIFAYNRFSKTNLFAVSLANTGTNISKHPLIKEADIIHLHWINQGFLSLKNIRQLAELGKPIVWTMHDMWPCTAICHHARECVNYQTTCKICFFLAYSSEKDLSTKVFLQKQKLYNHANIAFVACSNWLLKQAQQSVLLAKHVVAQIPNTLNNRIFTPLDKTDCRKAFGLPEDKKLILFSAVNISDYRKGFDYLADAIRLLLDKKDEIELVVTGNTKQINFPELPFKINYLSYIGNENDMAKVYNAINLYVTPSLEENLPNTIMEAMSCSTPCVGFDVGGIPEMIDHKTNGYVASYKSIDDLAAGIRWVLFEADYNELSEQARQKVLKTYSEKLVVGKYSSLYEQTLQNS